MFELIITHLSFSVNLYQLQQQMFHNFEKLPYPIPQTLAQEKRSAT